MNEKTFTLKINSTGKTLEVQGDEIGTYGGSIAIYQKRHSDAGEYFSMVFVAPTAHFTVI